MRLIGLVAALLGFAVSFAVVAAEDGERLGLELDIDHAWCTAGTVVAAFLQASGGEPPYSYSLQGGVVDFGRGTVREWIECDALPVAEDGEPAEWVWMTVRAEAVDAAGSRASAETRLLLAPPLPAPTGLHLVPYDDEFAASFEPPVGAASPARPAGEPGAPYLIRYRSVGDAEWRYKVGRERYGRVEFDPETGVAGEMQAAALRHEGEVRRPDMLNWSGTARYVASGSEESFAVTARGDRIEARTSGWSGYEGLTVELRGADRAASAEYERRKRKTWTNHAAFEGLPPNSLYALTLPTSAEEPETIHIVTPPTDAGPLALRLASPTGSCTAGGVTGIRWQASGGAWPYAVEIAGRTGEGTEGTMRIACGTASEDRGADLFGYAQRIVQGTVTDASGAVADAETSLLAGPPLAPPTANAHAIRGPSFRVEFAVPSSSRAGRSWPVAMRWREAGSTEWRYETGAAGDRPEDGGRMATGEIDAPRGLPSATVFEVQLATLRSEREIEAPQALRWSQPLRVATASAPAALAAEVGHDAISLSWGPQVEGLRYIATLTPPPPEDPDQPTERFQYGYSVWDGYRVEPGPPYGIAWTGLCPGTKYYAAVRSDVAAGYEWELPVGLLVTTEPGPDEPGPLVVTEAAHDRITLRWAEGTCVAYSKYNVSVREYGTGFSLRRSVPMRYFHRSDEMHGIAGLLPGSTYEISLSPMWWRSHDDPVIVVETPDLESETLSSDEPPDFTVAYGKWDRNQRSGTFKIDAVAGGAGALELEWHVEGRRVRRRLLGEQSTQVQLPAGWHEFRMRGFDADGRPTRWSAPVRVATTPSAPRIESRRYERDDLILTWNEPEGGIPIDRYIVEWRTDGSDWQEIEAGTGGTAAIPNAPFLDADEGEVRLRAVNDEYGAGQPGPARETPTPWPDWLAGVDARGCSDDLSGTLAFEWRIRGGVAPFKLELLPIAAAENWADAAVFEDAERSGRATFDCVDAAALENGRLVAAVRWRLGSYIDERRYDSRDSERFGEAYWGYQDSDEGQDQPYIEMPVPGRPTQSVHATHVKWDLGIGPGYALRWMVRTRTEAEPEWVERELRSGSWVMGWWYVADLEPGTRYEYVFGRDFGSYSEWSETGVVTTLADVSGIVVSEADGAVVVEWDGQPDAWKYLVSLRGQGRSWAALHDATDAAREQVAFPAAAGHAPYTAEITTPPPDRHGGDTSTFPLHQPPH